MKAKTSELIMKTVFQKILIALFFTCIVLATHSHHFMSVYHFPPAAFAVMYLGGVFLRRLSWYVYFILLVALIDGLTISLGAATGAYISWSYLFMFPAYGVLWLAGVWVGVKTPVTMLQSLLNTMISFLSILVAEAIASGSFYILKTQSPHNFSGFVNYYLTWAYQSVESFFFWVLPIMLVSYVAKVIAGLVPAQHHQDGLKP
jgi:hypothetical protein